MGEGRYSLTSQEIMDLHSLRHPTNSTILIEHNLIYFITKFTCKFTTVIKL